MLNFLNSLPAFELSYTIAENRHELSCATTVIPISSQCAASALTVIEHISLNFILLLTVKLSEVKMKW